jgi:hypothetical protein
MGSTSVELTSQRMRHTLCRLFYKYALTPALTDPYDFIWSFDNDIDVDETRPFRLLDATRAMAAAHVAIAQPLVAGGSGKGRPHPLSVQAPLRSGTQQPKGVVSFAGGAFPTLSHSAGGGLMADCLAQRVTFVESQTPLFARDAWRVLCVSVRQTHTLLLPAIWI